MFLKRWNLISLSSMKLIILKTLRPRPIWPAALIQSRVKLALTGTPVENSMSDLFSILSVVTPGLISDGLSSKYSRETDPEILKALSRSLKPFILRRNERRSVKRSSD